MIHLRNLKLKYQLVILISIGIFMMILIQFIYYNRFFYLIQDKAEKFTVNIMNQANDKLQSTTEGINKAAMIVSYNSTLQDYLSNPDISEKYKLYKPLINILSSVAGSNPNIIDIAFINSRGIILTGSGEFSQIDYLNLKSKYNLESLKERVFTPILGYNKGYGCYAFLMPIYNTNTISATYSKKSFGTCVVFCRANTLDIIVKDTFISKSSHFFIIDSSSAVAASNNDDIERKKFDISLLNTTLNNESHLIKKYKGKLSLIQYKTNNAMDWKIISIVPISELTSDLAPIRKLGVAIGVIMIALLLLVGSVFIRSITKPIVKMVQLMEEIGETNIKQRISMVETNEIGVIAHDINKMLDKIEVMTSNIFNMQTRLYEMELSKRETEISALQSQINPHFLYNTLECIRSIGLVYKIMDIVNISTAMAKIFRYCIKGSNYSTISEELDCIKDYLSIMSIRFMDKFDISINVDEELLSKQTVKMILQPIVENAIYHGLERKDGKGALIINGCLINERIQFQIIDDGVGISEPEVERINFILNATKEELDQNNDNQRSIGLFNINKRIKLYYGSEYGIYLLSKENEGVKVVIEIPLVNGHNSLKQIL